MATIRQRGNRFQVQIRLDGAPAKSKSFKTKKEAEGWAEAEEKRLKDLLSNPAALTTTLGYVLMRYRDTVAISQKGYKKFQGPYLTAFLREDICRKVISDLTINDFRAYRDRRLADVKPQTLTNEFAIYKKAFTIAAEDWDIPLPNFIKQLKFSTKSHERIRRVKDSEVQIIRQAISSRSTLSKERRQLIDDIFVFALETGMRRGEILRVQPKHYDAETCELLIPITKTNTPRTIGLSAVACEILDRRRNSDLCFPIAEEAFKTFWTRIKKQTGIEDIRFHDTRHEAISSFFDRGLTTPEVANQSGHKDFKTLARYSHARIQNIVKKLKSSH